MAGHPFGKYLLFDRLAAGGMAEIYKAKYVAAAGVTKQVVIKKILPHYAGNQNFVSMFINEAKIAVGLSHGNIAQVFDFGEIDGEYFLAMEYVHGQTVSKLLRRAKEKGLFIPPPHAVFIAMEMCRGLHHAHTRVDDNQRPLNIVHRDISPQNVIVSYEGQVKLVDFGIAKARSASDADKTQAGAIKGKYVYFSPEQARQRELDGRSDVFATGIVLYEMVCGRLPFEGKMVEVLNKIVRGDFVRPSQVNRDVDPKLEAIIVKALAVNRDERYASALAFQEALAGYLVDVAPRFNQANLAQLVDYLFADELSQEGREVRVPPEFIEQLGRWRDNELTRAPEPGRSPPPLVTNAERRSARGAIAPTIQEMEAQQPRPEPRRHTLSMLRSPRVRAGIAVGAFAAAAALGGTLVVTLGRSKSFAVKVKSSPPGLEIRVDGKPTGERTPGTVSGLSPDASHLVELSAPGMRPWSQQVEPVRGETVELEATLESIPLGTGFTPAPPETEDRNGRDEGVPQPPAALNAIYPQLELRMEAPVATVSIPASRAARVRLDPHRTYRLSVEGEAQLDDVQKTRGCFWFAERESKEPGESFGFLGPHDTAKISGVRVLYGFVVDPTPEDNTGALTLAAHEGKQATRLRVDARTNAIWPRANRGARFTGLADKGSFRLDLSGRVNLGPGAGSVDRAVYWYDGTVALSALEKTPDLTRGIVRAGAPVALESPVSLMLFLPDDDLGDNSGALDAKLTPTAPRTR